MTEVPTRAAPPPPQAVTSASPVWAKLAAIHDQSGGPSPALIERFRVAFTAIDEFCPDPSERVGDFLVAGQQQLAQRGRGAVTLLMFTEETAFVVQHAAVPVSAESCSGVIGAVAVSLLQPRKMSYEP
jgi:hypothetical protein